MCVDHDEDGVVDERGREGDGGEVDEGGKSCDDGRDVDGRGGGVDFGDVDEEDPKDRNKSRSQFELLKLR